MPIANVHFLPIWKMTQFQTGTAAMATTYVHTSEYARARAHSQAQTQ